MLKQLKGLDVTPKIIRDFAFCCAWRGQEFADKNSTYLRKNKVRHEYYKHEAENAYYFELQIKKEITIQTRCMYCIQATKLKSFAAEQAWLLAKSARALAGYFVESQDVVKHLSALEAKQASERERQFQHSLLRAAGIEVPKTAR